MNKGNCDNYSFRSKAQSRYLIPSRNRGVGGLVAVSVDGDYYFPGYDNNGNVIGYWNEDYVYNWRKHPNGIEMIQGHRGELVPVDFFGPNLNPNNLFGCYLSPSVRKQKEKRYSPTLSRKDDYKEMYKSVFHRLGRYLFAPEEECTRRIMIFEGERDGYFPVATKLAEAYPFPSEETYDYGKEKQEIEEMWRNLYEP